MFGFFKKNNNRISKKFIVLEGVDGSGKTTAALRLAKEYGLEYFKTPGDNFASVRPLFEDKAHVDARLYFYLGTVLFASEEIKRCLSSKKPAICDRYIYTTLIYHKVLGAKVSKGLEKEIISSIKMPDLCVFMYANAQARHARLGRRQQFGDGYRGDQWLEQNDQFQEQSMKFSKNYPMKRLDTSDMDIDQVCQALLKLAK